MANSFPWIRSQSWTTLWIIVTLMSLGLAVAAPVAAQSGDGGAEPVPSMEGGDPSSGDSEGIAAPTEMAPWLDALLPASLDNEHLGLRDAQWVCLMLLVVIGFLADLVMRRLLTFFGKRLFADSFGGMELVDRRRIVKPLGLLAQAVTWYYGTDLVGLPDNFTAVLGAALKLFTVVAAVWTVFMVIDLIGRFLKLKAESTETKFDDLLVPLISKALKVFTVCVGLVLMADLFQLEITALIGGLGLGGMALALASQDALQNVFGSLLVLTDRPFEIGDWIKAEGVEGTVEAVGVRSTRIRTFANSQVIIPNSKFTQSVVDNMGRRQFRRLRILLGLEYDSTPGQINAFCEGVRELIRRARFTRNDVYHVYFNDFGANSLDVLVHCFIECEDYAEELQQRHRLFLQILQLAEKLGLSFAFPTRTVHMFQQDPALPAKPIFDDPESAGRDLAAALAGPPLGSIGEQAMPEDERLGDGGESE